MHKILSCAILIGGACATQFASAVDYYVAASASPNGRAKAHLVGDGVDFNGDSSNRPVGLALAGGLSLSANFGVEMGYHRFGTADFDIGSGITAAVASHAYHLAGTASWPINEQWSLTGKLGLARRHVEVSASGHGESDSISGNSSGVYASVGGAYIINKNLAVTAELERYGNPSVINTFSWGMNALSLGLRYTF